MLRSPSLKQRPKPVAHSERNGESQVHSESVAEAELGQRCFATLNMTMGAEMN